MNLSKVAAVLMIFLSAGATAQSLMQDTCYVTDARIQRVVDAEAFLLNNSTGTLSVNPNGTYRIATQNLTSIGGLPVSSTSPFYNSLVAVGGRSGVLAAPDRILTASHGPTFDLSPYVVIFGLHATMSNGVCVQPDFTNIPADNVYHPLAGGQVINTYTSVVGGDGYINDYAVFQLDRTVVGRVPVEIRHFGSPSVNDHLTTVSHPLRMSAKFDPSAAYAGIDGNGFFRANYWSALDGSSGGVIFNVDRNVVEGSFSWSAGCAFLSQSNFIWTVVFDCGGVFEPLAPIHRSPMRI